MTDRLTREAVDRGAKALAEAVNGGDWEMDYTEAQKKLWRYRVEVAMITPDEMHPQFSHGMWHGLASSEAGQLLKIKLTEG